MNSDIKSKLCFINYSVNKVILEKNNEFQKTDKPIEVDFNLEHKTIFNNSNNKMNIILDLKVFDNAKINNFPFYMNINLEGEFITEGDNIEAFEINGIALLYPYIRSIVSTYTANSNIPTLILPSINVAAYYENNKKKKNNQNPN